MINRIAYGVDKIAALKLVSPTIPLNEVIAGLNVPFVIAVTFNELGIKGWIGSNIIGHCPYISRGQNPIRVYSCSCNRLSVDLIHQDRRSGTFFDLSQRNIGR